MKMPKRCSANFCRALRFQGSTAPVAVIPNAATPASASPIDTNVFICFPFPFILFYLCFMITTATTSQSASITAQKPKTGSQPNL